MATQNIVRLEEKSNDTTSCYTHARVINDFCPKSSEGTQDFDDPGRVSVIDA